MSTQLTTRLFFVTIIAFLGFFKQMVALTLFLIVLTQLGCVETKSTSKPAAKAKTPIAKTKDDQTNSDDQAKNEKQTSDQVEKQPGDLPIAWQIKEGLNAPESCYFDKDSGDLFLSVIVGEGNKKDGNGFIMRLSVDGKVKKEKWYTGGLNAPKGLRSHKGTLWISDFDRIVAVNIADGKLIEEVNVPEAKFLNDLACGDDGTVYVSDLIASRIYSYKDKKLSVFAEGEEIESPNGLLVDKDRIIVAAWGYCDNFQPETPGRLFSLDLKTKKKTLITKDPTGNLDGIELDGQGGYYVTDWFNGKLFHISGDGKVKLLKSFPKGAADHAYLVEKKLLILPHMMDNTLTAYKIGP